MAQTATLTLGTPAILTWASGSSEQGKAKAVTLPSGTRRLRVKPISNAGKSSNTGTADAALSATARETHAADIPEDIIISRSSHGHPAVVYLQMDTGDDTMEVTAYRS